MKKIVNKLLLGAVGLSFTPMLYAAPNAAIPASATPVGAVEQINLDKAQPSSKGTKITGIAPIKSSPITSTGPGKFILQSVELTGSRIPVPAAAQNLILSQQGKPIDFHGVQALAGQIEDAYRDEGWILNQVIIPPQRINPKLGKLHLQVVDGRISRVELVGDSARRASHQLQRYISQLEMMDPFNFKQAEHVLLLANDIPGLSVKGNLRADPQKPGASIMQISVQRKATQGLLNYNNRGSQYIGPNQALAQVQFNDLITADNVQLAAATTPAYASQLAYGNASYSWVMGNNGTQISLIETYAQTKPSGSFSSLGLVGKYQQAEISFTQPIIRSLERNFSALVNLYHTHNTSTYSSSGTVYNDQITGLQGGFNYQRYLLGGSGQAQVLLTQGLPFNGTTSSLPSRNGAKEDFTRGNVLASYTRYLTERISTVLAANGQYSPVSLPVSEQLGYGGSQFGVAYQPSEITGDSGILGSVSLRYDIPTNSLFQLLQPFASLDGGELWTNNPTAGQSHSNDGSSLGFGLNVALKYNLQGSLMAAKPLTTAPSNDANKHWLGFFNLSWIF